MPVKIRHIHDWSPVFGIPNTWQCNGCKKIRQWNAKLNRMVKVQETTMRKNSQQTLREQLLERAKQLSLRDFSNSLTAEEYREVTSFWGSTPEFWDCANSQKLARN